MTIGIFLRGLGASRNCLAALLGMVLLTSSAASAAEDAADSKPGRIVSLAPAITETLFALGLGDRVVGVSTYCDYPAAATRLPKVGTFSEPVAEVIVSLRPDLVLTSPSPGNEGSVRAIERAGVRVAVVRSEGGLAEARSAMLEVARAVGEAEGGERLVAGIDSRLDALRRAAAALDHPAAAVVIGREPLVLAGPFSYLGELLTLAGGTNITEKLGGRWPRVGIEFLVISAPQVLVDLSVSMEGEAGGGSGAANWKALTSVPAVATGRVVTDRDARMLRPGPRLGDAAAALFEALHPGVALPEAAKAR
jgi:iron complex transport system substrate-binding protein